MPRKAISIDQLTDAINDIIKETIDDVDDCVEKVAVQYAKIGKKMLEQESPKRTGKYAKGWAYKKSNKKGVKKVVIYNKAKPSLVHLLENGHAKVNGGFVPGKPHVAPVEEKLTKDFTDTLEHQIKSIK